MGAGYSTSQDQPPSQALHVLRVTPASPASQTNIEPFFDFVVGFEGDTFNSGKNVDASELERIVESHEDQVLNLVVWNSKSRDTRVVPIIPSRAWSAANSALPNLKESEPESKPSLLGLSMRMCQPEYSLDNVWHVLDVLEGSPAEDAGLVPYGDWIIGWSGGVLSAENDFYDVVEAHIDKPLRVYVYSHDFDTIREVVLVPNRQWGGEGLLGCVFGFGLLHRIPPQPSDREPGSTPPELREPGVGEYEEQTLFVPAQVPVPHPGTPEEHHFAFPHAHVHPSPHDGHHHHREHGHQHDHDHEHDHEHEYEHDHEHEHEHDHDHGAEAHNHEPPVVAAIAPTPTRPVPLRSTSLNHPGTPERSSTPTPSSINQSQGRPLGSLVNGFGSMNIGRYGPGMHSPTPQMERAVSFGAMMSSSTTFGEALGAEGQNEDGSQESGEQDLDYDDGATSVTGTETTDDETASQGSLTSVD
ncbi:hypothetical protein GLOTRDRAFT_141212 [Gloeophyllum trabeum ATCC 11539]|uniref:PDZ GRASP-type domain-containing protein n=1 Tax=Gloeophyllum trabeum (strain ATCC 11539 / FP-39264 / Madison 617) TaxID=670483 RepID=S7PTI5_GLOTA|nr:uncharacterized protein GLOTRDRAFT_141212 [Gloeophyllum trabeum ATCC 11539]EPQ51071.1 hypothetical protein GLOTRDRAFT_141212 [Gloeophyllum trabeum ATCC 11539]